MSYQRPWTNKDTLRLVELLGQKKTHEQIAAELGRHPSTIAKRVRAYKYRSKAVTEGAVPPRTIVNAAIREPLSGGNWTPVRPGAMDYLACKSRGIA